MHAEPATEPGTIVRGSWVVARNPMHPISVEQHTADYVNVARLMPKAPGQKGP